MRVACRVLHVACCVLCVLRHRILLNLALTSPLSAPPHRPFILGTAESKWRMTLAHLLPRLLHDRGLLHRLFTQNIDGIDYQAGLPAELIVAVHGSLGKVACEACGAAHAYAPFQRAVRGQIRDIYGVDAAAPQASTPILCEQCRQPAVKPATVLYGRELPREFFLAQRALITGQGQGPGPADLLLVLGSSMTVFPAAGLPAHLPPAARCIVINREAVPTGLDAARCSFIGGDADELVLALLQELGWRDDLRVHADKLCDHSRALLARSGIGAGPAPAVPEAAEQERLR